MKLPTLALPTGLAALSLSLALGALTRSSIVAAQSNNDEIDPGFYPGGTSNTGPGWNTLPQVDGSTINNSSIIIGGKGALLHYIDAKYDPTKIKRVVIQIHGDNRDAWNQWLYADLAAKRAVQGGAVKREEVLVVAPQFFVTNDYGAYPYTLDYASPFPSTRSSTHTRSSGRQQFNSEEDDSVLPLSRRHSPITEPPFPLPSSRALLEKRAGLSSGPAPKSTTNVLIWSGSNWGQGGPIVEPTGLENLSSFDALDAALSFFLDRNRFPALNKVVVAGFSLGAQLTHRYAVFRPADSNEKRVSFWVSSPNSFVYFNESRPLRPGRACQDTYNNYKYGLGGVLPTYATKASNPATDPAAIISRYLSRTITYLCGEKDKTAGASDCPSDCQGSHHVSKMYYWTQRVLPYLPGSTMDGTLPRGSSVHWVGKTGHQDWKIITSDPGVYSLFLQNYNDDGTDAAAPPSNGIASVKPPGAENPAGRMLPSAPLYVSALAVATSAAVVLISSTAAF